MPEILEVYQNTLNYNNAVWESNYIFIGDAGSISFSVYSNVSCKYGIRYYFDNKYELARYDENTLNGGETNKILSNVENRYCQFFVNTFDSIPCNLKTQAFFSNNNLESKIENFPLVQNIKTSSTDVFGNQVVTDLTPMIQYVFNNTINTSGSTMPSIGYDNIVIDSDSIDPSNQQTIQIYNNVIFLGVKSVAVTAHTYLRLRSQFMVPYRAGVSNVITFTGLFQKLSNHDSFLGFGVSNDAPTNTIYSGCFIGYVLEENELCIIYYLSGTKYYVKQSDWLNYNNSKSFVWSNANIFKIEMGYLGFYGYKISIMNPDGSDWLFLHYLSFVNTTTTPYLDYSSLGFIIQINRGAVTGTNDFMVGCGSMMIQSNSPPQLIYINDIISSVNPLSTYPSNVERVVLVVKSKSLFLNKKNFNTWILNHITGYATSTKPIIFRIYKGTWSNSYTFTGFTDVNTDVCSLEYTFNATNVALPLGHRVIHSFALKTGGDNFEKFFNEGYLNYSRVLFLTIYSTANITDAVFNVSVGDYH